MCPDSRILSVYFDRELPDPWRGRMEAHLAGCPRCRDRIALYGRVRDAGAASEGAEALDAARERVWRRLSGGIPPVKAPALWRRSVSLPLPAAAAAALVLAVLALMLLGGPRREAQEAMMAGISLDVQDIVPAADMNGVFQYLGGENDTEFVIIRLPENRNFSRVGQPAIMKAADYSRSAPSP